MFYRRHLPHWQRPNSALFITWRLHGSLPRSALAASLKQAEPGKRFLILDRELDTARYGPTWLADARLAKVVMNALHHGAEQQQLYRLSSFVIMSNHVHILIWPKAQLPKSRRQLRDSPLGRPIVFWDALERRSGKMSLLITLSETKTNFVES